MLENNPDISNDIILMLTATVIIGLIILLAFIMNCLIPFLEDRSYIKSEMERSYDDKEYQYWRRELKYLYLRSIPFIGRFFR